MLGLGDFCYDIQEIVASYLSTRDILSLVQVCWESALAQELERRQLLNRGFISIIRRVPLITCKYDLNELLRSFLSELSLHTPALAIIHIPQLFVEHCYRWNNVDITKIFPEQTVVIKMMESIFGASENLSHLELQAFLINQNLRSDVRLSYFLTKEFSDGSCSSFYLDNCIPSPSMPPSPGFCWSFEVTQEMKTQPSCFSQCKIPCVFGTNFVTDSSAPENILKKGRKIEGMKKLKKEFINGFLLSGDQVGAQSFLLDNVDWQSQLSRLDYSAKVFTFIFLHKKASADLRLIIESQLIRNLPKETFCLMNCCNQRFSTSFGDQQRNESVYRRPQPLETFCLSENNTNNSLPVLRKISAKEEVLVIQLEMGKIFCN